MEKKSKKGEEKEEEKKEKKPTEHPVVENPFDHGLDQLIKEKKRLALLSNVLTAND